jgi:hypothetical protein
MPAERTFRRDASQCAERRRNVRGTRSLNRCRNNQKKENDMVNASQIREHMEIKGSDGQHVGTVDRVEGNCIKLTKSDKDAAGHHQYMDMASVREVKDGCLITAKTADECKRTLQ